MPGAAVVIVKLSASGTVATVQVPLTPAAPSTPLIVICWPGSRKCLARVVSVGFVVLATPVTLPPLLEGPSPKPPAATSDCQAPAYSYSTPRSAVLPAG